MDQHKKSFHRQYLKVTIMIICCSILFFFIGYQVGVKNQSSQSISIRDNVASDYSVVPLQKSPQISLPHGHPAIPQTDMHGHPTFDCSALTAPILKAKGDPMISELSKKDKLIQNEVNLSAIVVHAYFGILGTNWYHLCDEPSGQVLIVSSDQHVSPKSLIKVRGSLLFDYNLKNIYRFPMYIEKAILRGDKVKTSNSIPPKGTIEL